MVIVEDVSCNHLLTVSTAIRAAGSFGKPNSPVEMPQKAIEVRPAFLATCDNSCNNQQVTVHVVVLLFALEAKRAQLYE